MPGIEKEKMENPDSKTQQPEAGDQAQPVAEEITLTDRLNKKLLTSFLERINNTDFPINVEESSDNAASSSSSNDYYNEFL